MPSDTYILTISEAGVSVPSSHASTHITGGSDVIPTATSSTSGLMSAAIFNQHVTNTAKVSNITHTGDVTDASGVLTVNKINGVSMAGLATGILKNTTSTGVPSIAVAADFPTLNQSTTGNAATATTATTATNLAGGAVGSVPYQTGSGATALLAAGTAGYVLKSNGSAAPSWSPVDLSAGISGSLPVASGGTGAATFTAGVLKANGTSSFTTVAAPTGDIVGTTDLQTLTNKTFGTNTTFSTAIPVASGGTGAATFTAGILRANGTSSFSTITAPTGDIVGTTDTQTLTNKTLTSPTISSGTISSASITGGTITGLSSSLLPASGGTGISSYSIGDILYANSTSSLDKLADVATGNVLISGGVGVAPLYGKVGLTTHVSGILPVANGGTGTTSSTGSGANVFATSPTLVTPVLGTPTSGTLTNCAGLPITNGTTGVLPISRGGTGQSSFLSSGNLYYDSVTDEISIGTAAGTLNVDGGGTGVTSFANNNSLVLTGTTSTGALQSLTSGTSGQVLLSNGAGNTPSFGSLSLTNTTGTLDVTKGGTGLTTSTARAIVVGGTTNGGPLSQISTGTAGQVLTSGGSSADPSWTTLSGTDNVDILGFDTTPSSTTLTEGQCRWDSTWRTLDVALVEGYISQYGEQTVIRGRIGGGTVNIGDPIYQYGQASDYFFIAKASSDSQGFNAIHSGIGINVGASGPSFTYTYAVMRGVARNVPTPSGGGSGSPIYLTSAGALTVTAPAFPARRIRVGFIIKTSTNTSTNDGTILVDPHYYDAVSARSGGIISQFYSPVATVNADDTLLNSYTVSPSTFTADGDTIDAEYMLTRALTNANQTYNVLFNGSSVFGGAITINANVATSAKIFVKLIRRSSSVIAASFEFQYAHVDGSSSQVRHGAITISYDSSTSTTLVLRGTSVSGAPLFAQYGEISFNPSSSFVI